MPGRGPITLSLPAFRGAVRQLVLVIAGVFFAVALLQVAVPAVGLFLAGAMVLEPAAVLQHFQVWRLLTYAFLNLSLLGTAFSLLTLWFTGTMLEEARGPRWFIELFYVCVAAGAVLATLLVGLPILTGGRISFFGIHPTVADAGLNAPLFGVLVAFALLFGDVEFLLFFFLRIKAKYMVTVGALVYVATLLRDRNSFAALLALCCGLAGFLYVRFARRSGMAGSASERYYGLRNAYYRWKRRRAARKFQVYMRKQDREVTFDKNGRYIAPEDEPGDPDDRSWMN